jgi:exopolyphosphatase/guanosine-5'-triphosphate,3'-diphosphate pyrophosphatase
MRSLLTTRLFVRARILGAVMRVGYLLSASMPGILPHTKLSTNMDCLNLSVPKQFSDLISDRFVNRLKALGRLIGSETQINILN